MFGACQMTGYKDVKLSTIINLKIIISIKYDIIALELTP